MAKTRTIGVNDLTANDARMLAICLNCSDILRSQIPDQNSADEFTKQYGRISNSRDAGMGVGAGKLQRDALTTRGRTDKSPFSNRNFRWHPLILAYTTPPYAREVVRIETSERELIFVIDGKSYHPGDLYKLSDVYCAPYAKWGGLIAELAGWDRDDWSENRCTIPALEYSSPAHCVTTYASLGIAIACGLYSAPAAVYDRVLTLLEKAGIDQQIIKEVPPLEHLVKCPLCLTEIGEPPGQLLFKKRAPIWQPPWRSSKRTEGAEAALQITHMFPLVENEIRHRSSMVRYGHRWCNVAMTDHSVDETVDFMKAIVTAQESS